jgi:hypothetical protein
MAVLRKGTDFSGSGGGHPCRECLPCAITVQRYGPTLLGHFRNYLMQSLGHLESIQKVVYWPRYACLCKSHPNRPPRQERVIYRILRKSKCMFWAETVL